MLHPPPKDKTTKGSFPLCKVTTRTYLSFDSDCSDMPLASQAAAVRDQEEPRDGGAFPHPILVPLADTNFHEVVRSYDYARVDVWGVQPYRGTTFTDLFEEYVSNKPLADAAVEYNGLNPIIFPAPASPNRSLIDVSPDIFFSKFSHSTSLLLFFVYHLRDFNSFIGHH
jgi:hypothetical protein